jgi:hypothetical protein
MITLPYLIRASFLPQIFKRDPCKKVKLLYSARKLLWKSALYCFSILGRLHNYRDTMKLLLASNEAGKYDMLTLSEWNL